MIGKMRPGVPISRFPGRASMDQHHSELWRVIVLVIFIVASGCSAPLSPVETALPVTDTRVPSSPTSEPTQTPTSTPVTPTETQTPLPSATPTLAFTDTPVPTETSTASPTAAFFLLPAAREGTVNIYFIQLNSGIGACGDRLIAIGSGEPVTGKTARDVTAGLNKLFSYRKMYYGELYNPQGASRFRVDDVSFDKKKGEIVVYLRGSFNRPEDPCENTRLKTQIWATISQFPEIEHEIVFLNRVLLGDLISND